MWSIAYYQATSLFSLRPALSTASGAQSLLVPTPFAIKMALIDVAITHYGIVQAVPWWPVIRDLSIALSLPQYVVVNKTFIKIQRKGELPKQKGVDKDQYIRDQLEEGKWPLSPTIAFREFVGFDGLLGVALQAKSEHAVPLGDLLRLINYFGKRGSFMQIQGPPIVQETIDDSWTVITQSSQSFPIDGTLQMLDDCGKKLSWEHVDVYSEKRIRHAEGERELRTVILPYRLRQSSYRYSFYERI